MLKSEKQFHSVQPKPILVDKQSSEPNSPIAKNFDDHQHHHQQHQHDMQLSCQKRPPMHRGFSDLGNRMKKRVTLRYAINSHSLATPISLNEK